MANYVAMHIRRGDYVRLKDIHLVCDTDYYLKAAELFPNKKIVIFTDDEAAIRNEFNIQKLGWKIMKTDSDLDALEKMSCFKNIIISNSSFSWWASKLGVKCDVVVAPSRWYSAKHLKSTLQNDKDFIVLKV